MYQIVTFPIVNYVHFIISFIPVIYLILKHYKNNNYVFILLLSAIVSSFLTFNFAVIIGVGNYNYLEKYQLDNFMKNRITYSITDNFVLESKKYIDQYNSNQAINIRKNEERTIRFQHCY